MHEIAHTAMMTSSNVNIFRVTGTLREEFISQRPVARRFDVFSDLRLNKRLSKQSRRRWFETSSRTSWCHCNDTCALNQILICTLVTGPFFCVLYAQRAQMHFKDILKTSLQDWSSRRVWRLKNVNRPVVLKTYFQSPQDQFSKRLEAQAWCPFQDG